ncbi:MAG: glycosyltransferase family 1 protein [Candidatus Daviesbacteria bacterium]|nr:glycosyltransferase family 1 protein [Candidatus Daviesbacteria bacterium]
MKIAIDGYEANVLQRLGSSQVAFELIKNLEKIDRKNDYTILLPSAPMEDFPKERQGWKYKILKPKMLWTRIALPLFLYTSRQKVDLIFSPTHYIPRFSSVKRVVTIFDLSFLHFPESFLKKDLWQLKNWTKFSAQEADHIITISNFSKKDIIKQYGVSSEKITIAYPGFNKDIFKPIKDKEKKEKIIKEYGLGDSFLIYIGTIQPRKNLVRLMEAIARIENLQLVIVGKTRDKGKSGWMFDKILQTPKNLGIEERVKFTGFVKSEDLPYLISGAKAFILPSLWEGFGIPVLEAMACGVPTLISNNSSLPEITGKGGIKFDPYSVDQIEQAIRTIISDKKLWQKYSKEALIQSKKYSWKKMAREVKRVFEIVGEIA